MVFVIVKNNKMPLTSILQVSCLVCNSKVEISSTKNIFKTAFAKTAENLAVFVSKTLPLAAVDLRSSYLCLQCLNLFGKLEEALRKMKSIKSEIQKVFEDSYNNKINSHATSHNAKKDAATNSQVFTVKPRAVITQCAQKTNSNILLKKEPINRNAPTNSETKNTNIMQIKNDYLDIKLTKLKALEQKLKSTDVSSQSPVKKIVNLDKKSVSFNNDVASVPLSLKDHQYSQLPITKQVLTCEEPIVNPKVLSTLQQKMTKRIVKNILDSKKAKMPKQKYYTCCNCSMKKDTLKELKLHYKTHPDFYPYMCDRCGKVYKSQKGLKFHIATHDGISPYMCTKCDKCFTQKSALKRHLPIHTGEKPYECPICSKKFTHRTSYKMHILSHSQEKKYKCDLCPIAFMSTSHLNRHMRTHGGEKRHSCEICGKSFFERYNVVAHMKVHDPEQHRLKEAKRKQKRVIRHRCERCKINFRTMGEYNVHLHSHTPENVMPYG